MQVRARRGCAGGDLTRNLLTVYKHSDIDKKMLEASREKYACNARSLKLGDIYRLQGIRIRTLIFGCIVELHPQG